MAVRFTTFRMRALSGAASIALSALAAVPALAQDAAESTGGLEEIVVTAQHREERLQDVPIAVAAVTANALKDNGVDSTRDLPQLVPSVQFTRSGASGLLFVRGVGTTNAAVGEEGANAVYVDDVYMADLSQVINNFNNIERIEVLKGPQGTLFGRNATGGLVHIITREPGDQVVVDAEGGIANYKTFSGRIYAATPLTDKLSADIALTGYDQDEGFGKNLTLNKENKLQNYWGARSKWVLRATDTVKFTLTGDYNHSYDNLALGYRQDPDFPGRGVTAAAPAPTTTGWNALSNHYPTTRLNIWGVSFKGEADLGFAKLTSVTAYRKTENKSDFDVEGSAIDQLNIAFTSGTKSFQQEFRLASNASGPFTWQAGVFYLHAESENDSIFSGSSFAGLGAGGRQHIVADLKSNSYAAFAEATYDITPTTHLTGGIRYTADRRHFVGAQTNINNALGEFPGTALVTPGGVPLAGPGRQDSRLSYDKVTWRVALRQELSDDISVYASVNKGFKSGSYSLQSPTNDPYLPQYIMAYEAGFKSELFDRRLRFNAAYFHYDIDDYQVRSAAITPSGPGSSVILNAATVKVDGVDVEFEAKPTDALRLFGGFTWLNSRYGKFGGVGASTQAPILYLNPATCPANLVGTRNPGVLGAGPRTGGFTTCFGDVSGLSTMNAPDFTGSFGAAYTVPLPNDGSVRLSALYNYNSGYVFEPDNKAKQGEYSLVNASAEYRPNEHFGVEVWGRNVFNKQYSVQKISTSGLSVTTTLGAPATYGVTFKVNY